MSYFALYVVFGVIFVGSIIAYWVMTRVLRDPAKVYESGVEPGKG